MPASDLAEPTRAVRAFNRFYTAQVGALGGRHLHTTYSLTEARVIFELAHRDVTEVPELRRQLGLDASYMSRILARFERDGLVSRDRSETDARKQLVRLTDRGRAEFGELDSRSSAQVSELLGGLTDSQRARLLTAMGVIRGVLDDPTLSRPAVLRPLRPGDLGWVVQLNARVYADEYGWDASYEALVARIVADYADSHDPTADNAWIAEVDGVAVGAVFCVRKDDETAQLRLLIVDPAARGRGIGARLVDECIEFATAAGYRRIVLWTNDVLVQARKIYQRAGFVLTNEEPHHSFGHDLTGQWWERDLNR